MCVRKVLTRIAMVETNKKNRKLESSDKFVKLLTVTMNTAITTVVIAAIFVHVV